MQPAPWLIAGLLAGATAPVDVPQAQRSVAVQVGGDAESDACDSLGQVAGLNPQGDNFLAVRSGPGRQQRETDRLRGGNRLWICETRGDWLGIVYAPGGGERDCGVGTPRLARAAYRGPCRSGWVHRNFVEVIAG